MKAFNIQLNTTTILLLLFVILLIIGTTVIITKNVNKCECPNLQKYDNKFETNVE